MVALTRCLGTLSGSEACQSGLVNTPKSGELCLCHQALLWRDDRWSSHYEELLHLTCYCPRKSSPIHLLLISFLCLYVLCFLATVVFHLNSIAVAGWRVQSFSLGFLLDLEDSLILLFLTTIVEITELHLLIMLTIFLDTIFSLTSWHLGCWYHAHESSETYCRSVQCNFF